MTVTLRCTYHSDDEPDTEIEFEPDPAIAKSPTVFLETIQALVRLGKPFEIPVARGEPIPVHPDTVMHVEVR